MLYVIAGLPAGGAERQMSLLVRAMDRQRYEPGLLIFGSAAKIHYRDVFESAPWFRALELSGHSPARLFLPILRGIDSAVRSFRPDVVHSSLNVANHMVRIAAALNRWHVPIVTSVRNDFRSGYRAHEKLAERLLWRRSACIACNAPRVSDQLAADLGIPESRLAVVPNGIEDVFFDDAAAPPPGWWPAGNVALVLGRFSAQKNPLALIRAFALAARDPAADGWTLTFVGEGPLRPEMEAATDAAGLAGRILIRAPETDVKALYRASAAVVLPSLYEGMSNVCLEAAASARLLLVSRSAGADEIVSGGGAWEMPDDDDGAARALVRLFGSSVAERNAAGAKGRALMRERHSVGALVAETAAIYDRLFGQPGDRRQEREVS